MIDAWALLLGASLAAATPIAADDARDLRARLDLLRRQDERVAAVAFRLARDNVALCGRRTALAGVVLQTDAQYGGRWRDAARRYLGVGARPTVVALAPDSPGERAGLRRGDALVAIGGEAAGGDAANGRAGRVGAAAAYALLDGARLGEPLAVSVIRGGAPLVAELKPVPGCAGRAQLTVSAEFGASADARTVSITDALAIHTRSEDELAVILAHEWAHLIMKNAGRREAASLAVEREADRLGLFLAARAGYRAETARDLWPRLDALARRTHVGRARTGSPGRLQGINAALGEIAAKRRTGALLIPDGWTGAR